MADPNVSASVVAAVAALITVVGTVVAARINRKDKLDRAADRDVQRETAEKLHAEKDEIRVKTSGYVLKQVQDTLDRTKQELIEAYENADRLRIILTEKNDTIDLQDRKIRRLARRAEVLEEWINNNRARFKELGINGLPDDIEGDREHGRDMSP